MFGRCLALSNSFMVSMWWLGTESLRVCPLAQPKNAGMGTRTCGVHSLTGTADIGFGLHG
jgi:hypothetical protein